MRKVYKKDEIRITGLSIYNASTGKVSTVSLKRNTEQFNEIVKSLGYSRFQKIFKKVVSGFTLAVLLIIPYLNIKGYNFIGHKKWYWENVLEGIKLILGQY